MEPALEGWAKICFDGVVALFDAAHDGLGRFVERDLQPLELQLALSADLRLLGEDLRELAQRAAQRDAGPMAPLVLPSERRLARAFARESLGPDALDRHLSRTFAQVQAALARRHGATWAAEQVEGARRDFEPVRQEAARLLSVRPRLLRAILGPARYLAVPLFWVGAWSLDGGARRRQAARDVVRELGISRRPPRGIAARAAGAVLMGSMCVLGAGLVAAVAHRALDVRAMYGAMLDDVEALVLYGSVSDEPGARRFGPGLVDIMMELEGARP